jgi:hypothetical protein
MKYLSVPVVCGLALLGGAAALPAQDKGGQGNLVIIDGLKSQAPTGWKAEKPANRLRSHQFLLPRVKGDSDDALLVIFPDQTRPAEKALTRWQELFEPPSGKTLEEVTRVNKAKAGKADLTFLDVHGTYLDLPRPLAPKNQAKRRPDYRMVAVFFDTPEGAHLIRLIGPERTVEEHRKGFEDWVKGFK